MPEMTGLASTYLQEQFAKAYPVALLARNPDNYKDIVDEINKSGGKAIGISTDVSDSASVKAAFKQIEQELGESCYGRQRVSVDALSRRCNHAQY